MPLVIKKRLSRIFDLVDIVEKENKGVDIQRFQAINLLKKAAEGERSASEILMMLDDGNFGKLADDFVQEGRGSQYSSTRQFANLAGDIEKLAQIVVNPARHVGDLVHHGTVDYLEKRKEFHRVIYKHHSPLVISASFKEKAKAKEMLDEFSEIFNEAENLLRNHPKLPTSMEQEGLDKAQTELRLFRRHKEIEHILRPMLAIHVEISEVKAGASNEALRPLGDAVKKTAEGWAALYGELQGKLDILNANKNSRLLTEQETASVEVYKALMGRITGSVNTLTTVFQSCTVISQAVRNQCSVMLQKSISFPSKQPSVSVPSSRKTKRPESDIDGGQFAVQRRAVQPSQARMCPEGNFYYGSSPKEMLETVEKWMLKCINLRDQLDIINDCKKSRPLTSSEEKAVERNYCSVNQLKILVDPLKKTFEKSSAIPGERAEYGEKIRRAVGYVSEQIEEMVSSPLAQTKRPPSKVNSAQFAVRREGAKPSQAGVFSRTTPYEVCSHKTIELVEEFKQFINPLPAASGASATAFRFYTETEFAKLPRDPYGGVRDDKNHGKYPENYHDALKIAFIDYAMDQLRTALNVNGTEGRAAFKYKMEIIEAQRLMFSTLLAPYCDSMPAILSTGPRS